MFRTVINPANRADLQCVVNTLCAVQDLLNRPETWTTGTLARRRSGTPCAVTDPAAVRWCLAGALEKACGDRATYLAVRDFCQYTNLFGVATSLARFNDSHTYARMYDGVERALQTVRTRIRQSGGN